MKVPPGNIPVPAVPDFAAMVGCSQCRIGALVYCPSPDLWQFRVSMAAIDPTAEPEYDDVDDKKPPRSTLKILRIPGHIFDDEDESEDDEDDLLDG